MLQYPAGLLHRGCWWVPSAHTVHEPQAHLNSSIKLTDFKLYSLCMEIRIGKQCNARRCTSHTQAGGFNLETFHMSSPEIWSITQMWKTIQFDVFLASDLLWLCENYFSFTGVKADSVLKNSLRAAFRVETLWNKLFVMASTQFKFNWGPELHFSLPSASWCLCWMSVYPLLVWARVSPLRQVEYQSICTCNCCCMCFFRMSEVNYHSSIAIHKAI